MTIPANLPADVVQGLSSIIKRLGESAGDNLQSLILYGGGARGRYHPGSSDINLMILLKNASTAMLKQIAPALEQGQQSIRLEPFILTTEEFQRAAEAFPTKFIEIRNHHVVLLGPDPFADMQISRNRALIRIEQELLNLHLRLRRRYLAIHESPELMYQALRQSVVSLAVTLDAMLDLCGRPEAPANTRAGILQQAAGRFKLDQPALADLGALRAGEPPALPAADLYARVLDLLARAAECCVSNIQEAP